MKLFIRLSIVLLLLLSVQLKAQVILHGDYNVIKGVVVDADNDSLLSYANVYNVRTMRGTVTNKLGYFRYYGLPGDTLWVSSMGYYPLPIIVDSLNQNLVDTFYLQAKTFHLPTVEIIELTRYEKLKYDIISMDIPKDIQNARNNFPIVNHHVNAFYERNNENFGLQVGGPITALYHAFSKAGREEVKLAKLKEQDAIKQKIDPHFNDQLVTDITGLKGKELYDFIEYCDFSESFLLNSKDYYIIQVIIEHYKEYCVLKSKNKNN